MAKKKRMGKGNYTSKGQRPNVSRKIRNAVKREKLDNNFLEGMLSRQKLTKDIKMKVGKNKRLTDQEQSFYNKLLVKKRAEELYGKWKRVATYAACVQAVKTDYIPQFENICHERNSKGVFRI